MEIKKVKNGKEKYLELLLEADPEKDVVLKYIDGSDMYILQDNEKVLAEIVITKVDNETCELKNIATTEWARGKGYASKMIKHVFDLYKKQYKRMIVGTTENMIPFYVLNGFTKYYHTAKNFFIDNYKEEIWDGNMQCIDMYYYSKEFNEEKKFNYEIAEIDEQNRKEANSILIDEWESTDIIIRGKVIDGTELSGLLAIEDKQILGLITYMFENDECEICSLNSFIENKGIGTSLINKVKEIATKNNCKSLKLITTNNNIKAIEFYQRRGFEISNIYINSMENARKLKPSIPMFADNGLPIKDEIEMKMKMKI